MQRSKTEEQTNQARRRRRKRPRSGGPKRPIPLHKRCGSHFQPADRQLGEEYYREDRVRFEVEGAQAQATVEGSLDAPYRLGVDWSRVPTERILHGFCECPRFASGAACKHLWATLLALGESGIENQPPGRDRLALRKDRTWTWDAPSSRLGDAKENGRRPGPPRASVATGHASHRAAAPSWRSQLDSVTQEIARLASSGEDVVAPQKAPVTQPVTLHFLINTVESAQGSAVVLDVFGRGHDSKGNPGKLKRRGVEPSDLVELLLPPRGSHNGDSGEFALIEALPADRPRRAKQARGRRGRKQEPAGIRRLRLPRELNEPVLSNLTARGVLSAWDGRSLRTARAVSWDPGPPWRLGLGLEVASKTSARLTGSLERKQERVPLDEAQLVLLDEKSRDARVLLADRFVRVELDPARDLPWLRLLRDTGDLRIPLEHLEEVLKTLVALPTLPNLEVPDELQLDPVDAPLQPMLRLERPPAPEFMTPPLLADVSFEYGSVQVNADDPRESVVDWQERRFLRRDAEAESKALVRLLELGLRPVENKNGHGLELSPADLPVVIEPLLAEGWAVEVHGTTVHPPDPPSLKVESGIDWFELSGEIDFGGDRVDLSAVLGAISRGDRFLELNDGSRGLLPATWMDTYDSLSNLAHSSSEEGLRFLPSQALLVDALLTAMPPADVDRAFADLRHKLQSFERIKPKRELKSFRGELRGYQREGLGWLDFLREFGLGGVLADDMGLGKTVQVLALLHAHRTPAKTTKLPSLVVAPRSVVYNWIEEASKFTPKLRVVEYRGADREKLRAKMNKFDVVVTTYGTMRRDISYLATVEFDTVVLDEAQAIKNPASQTAKASRLLQARHRLALTGTPIENHLGELGSLFEFLNPGLLGRLPWLDVLAGGRVASRHELAVVAEGIRPFILRRTKAQVLPDLPPKTEQVLHCTLRPEQQELYNQLRAQYQVSLMQQVESKGVAGSTIQVLQALLRLRQVACHPGLVNEEWEEAGSAKLEALFEQVEEVLDEGHKVLVFSQFTKLLGYVRRHLDAEGTPYAYLDGKTRNRGEIVDRFQTDPDTNLFLVSLKAGGTGLNLTAAGYVFLLDPWWNPAVEAQAIDRAHRIGQTQPVFAYRLIARDTVEEKILELQKSKRQIADAILEGEGTSISELTADDLRLLLS
jgi:superfamily II DNA or RNA helicase